MRSRVNKNAELYTQIANDTESKVESNDLSHFANRLNAIDEQFGKMNVVNEQTCPNHARSIEETYQTSNQNQTETPVSEEPYQSQEEEVKPTANYDQPSFKGLDDFDTFESTYLNDFLAEVKEYNVTKGYRDENNTSTNIMRDLNLDIEFNKSRVISDQPLDGPYIPEGIDDLITEIDPLLKTRETAVFGRIDIEPEVKTPDEISNHFTAVDHLQRFDQDQAHIEKTIAIEVQRMVEEDYVPSNEDEEASDLEAVEIILDELEHDQVPSNSHESAPSTDTDNESSVDLETQLEGLDMQVSPADMNQDDATVESLKPIITSETRVGSSSIDDETAKRLMEQTQTLQIKVIDNEKNIEDMTETMVKTNRLLNVTLSLLMLAIFVVIILIVFTKWR